ncbi:MAG: hypothetical protein RL685_7008 [Pseudomonadota bacterium]|jgi:hypothetical protein
MSLPGLPVFDFEQVLPLGFRFPARMSVLPLGEGQLALVSPIPIDDGVAAAIGRLGEVRYLIAPNLLHHLYLPAACQRYPAARVLAPAGLQRKRPELHIHATLAEPLPADLVAAVDVLALDGVPGIEEYAFYHRAARTLVLTDLVFHVLEPQGWLAHLTLWLGGCHGRLAASRFWRVKRQDRAAFSASVQRLLALPFETLVMAHGQIVSEQARPRLAEALAWAAPRSRGRARAEHVRD